jgi:outer membrane protein assembly factor BamB
MATAPEDAVCMATFPRTLRCQGELHFDDIYVKTEAGLILSPKPETLPPQLPRERLRDTFFVDMGPVANRGS